MRSQRLFAGVAMAFLLVAGIGAATSYWGDAAKVPPAPSHSGPNDEMLARLKDYARAPGAEKPVSATPTGKPLADVDTMIERLAARLQTMPGDIKGWRMLGWSYFNTERYEQAAAAYAQAVKLDPKSSELRLAYEEAKAKAKTKTSGLPVAQATKPEATPPHGQDAAIRVMVDGLAARLENSPRDVEGWTRLLRSRVVLGESEVAVTAFRKALEIFKDDSAASSRIRAAAIELGLKAE